MFRRFMCILMLVFIFSSSMSYAGEEDIPRPKVMDYNIENPSFNMLSSWIDYV